LTPAFIANHSGFQLDPLSLLVQTVFKLRRTIGEHQMVSIKKWWNTNQFLLELFLALICFKASGG
jgi:hypothetical protein